MVLTAVPVRQVRYSYLHFAAEETEVQQSYTSKVAWVQSAQIATKIWGSGLLSPYSFRDPRGYQEYLTN